MSKLLDRAVAKNAGGGWDFTCPGIKGSLCGDRDTGVPFTSTGWPTKATALARGREHFDDHLGKAPMPSLEDFRARHGLTVDDDGNAITLADLED
jgi:hypothetical protein